MGDHVNSKSIGIESFNYAEQYANLKIFIERLWRIRHVGGGLTALQSFWLLKRALKLLILLKWALSRYYRTSGSIRSPEKNINKIKIHPGFFFLQRHFYHIFLKMRAWNINSSVLWYVKSDGVILIKIPWFSAGVYLFFKNQATVSGSWPSMDKPKVNESYILRIKQLVVTNCSKELPGSIVNETLFNGIFILKHTSKESLFLADFKYISFIKFSLCHQKLRAWENLPYFGKWR